MGFTDEYVAMGEAKGEAKALVRLLEKRFGTLPPKIREQISTADITSLEAWFDRALDSNDLQSIFGSN